MSNLSAEDSSEQNPKRKHFQAFVIIFALVLMAPIYALFDLIFIGHLKMPPDDVLLLLLTIFSMITGVLLWIKYPAGLPLCKIAFVLWPVYLWWAHWQYPDQNSMPFAISVTVVAIPLLIVSFFYNLEAD